MVSADREALAQALVESPRQRGKYSATAAPFGWKSRKADEVVIRVRDEGFGIALRAAADLSEFTAAPRRRSTAVKGTAWPRHGEHIVDAHAGRVAVDSEPFEEHLHDILPAGGCACRAFWLSRTSRDIALGLQEDLRCHGHEVETVADGESAARRGKEPGWDLILLDLMLRGWTATRFASNSACRRANADHHAHGQDPRSREGHGPRPGSRRLHNQTFQARESCALGSTPCCGGPQRSRQGSIGLGTAKSTSTAVRCGGADRVEVTALEFRLLSAFIRRGTAC